METPVSASPIRNIGLGAALLGALSVGGLAYLAACLATSAAVVLFLRSPDRPGPRS